MKSKFIIMGVIKKAIKPMFKTDKWHIVRGDTVKLLCGKDKGQVGTVLKVFRDERIPRVLVGGLNLVSSLHVRAARKREQEAGNTPDLAFCNARICAHAKSKSRVAAANLLGLL